MVTDVTWHCGTEPTAHGERNPKYVTPAHSPQHWADTDDLILDGVSE
jgi:hypothetical protein